MNPEAKVLQEVIQATYEYGIEKFGDDFWPDWDGRITRIIDKWEKTDEEVTAQTT